MNSIPTFRSKLKVIRVNLLPLSDFPACSPVSCYLLIVLVMYIFSDSIGFCFYAQCPWFLSKALSDKICISILFCCEFVCFLQPRLGLICSVCWQNVFHFLRRIQLLSGTTEEQSSCRRADSLQSSLCQTACLSQFGLQLWRDSKLLAEWAQSRLRSARLSLLHQFHTCCGRGRGRMWKLKNWMVLMLTYKFRNINVKDSESKGENLMYNSTKISKDSQTSLLLYW